MKAIHFGRALIETIVFGNFFIALCSLAMLWSTLLMNDLPLSITPLTVFIFFSTYLLYNFHRISFKLNYSSFTELILSFRNITLKKSELWFYAISLCGLLITFFYLHNNLYIFLFPLAFLSISYSIPVFRRREKSIRLLDVFLVKTPALGIVWGLTTTILPLVEQNISLSTPFVWLQVLSRCLFIFVLCLPFEMRDLEGDRKKGITTVPVMFGLNATIYAGAILIAIEIISHHLMRPISVTSAYALDISSLIALFLVIRQKKATSPYYYKLHVDGTMLIRFILLFIAIRFG